MGLLKNKIIQGTLILTLAGIIVRIMGFLYRIYLASILGTHLLGIYQMIFPVFALLFTLYGAGIQTAISQMIAAESAKENFAASPHRILFFGTILSFSIACTLSLLLYSQGDRVAANLLLEPACGKYLKILSAVFPFCSISSCINGYYYGMQEAKIPAISQIIEQLVRVSFVLMLCIFFSPSEELCCQYAVWGLVAGEAGSNLFNVTCYFHSKSQSRKKRIQNPSQVLPSSLVSKKRAIFRPLLHLAVALTSTKLVISTLHSVEAVFIPAALRKYGCSGAEALSTYGVLSGMTMPFLLFPTTITSSFAVMLLPSIAKLNSSNNTSQVNKTVSLTTQYCLQIGFLFTGIFLLFGVDLGQSIFQNKEAGIYLAFLAILCPFINIGTTYASIVNGLGQAGRTFVYTVISLLIKLAFLIILVPIYGIMAYLLGSILSQIILCIMEWNYLKNFIYPNWTHWLIIPLLSLLLTALICKIIFQMLEAAASLPALIVTGGKCGSFCLIYLLILWFCGSIVPIYSLSKE